MSLTTRLGHGCHFNERKRGRRGHSSLLYFFFNGQRFCSARHLLVSFSGRAFGFVDEALATLDRSRRVVMTVNQFFTAGKVVTSSDLLTVLPRHFVKVTGYADMLVVRELPFAVAPIHVDALWHQRQEDDAAHTWLRTQIAGLAQLAFPTEGL